MTLISVCRSHLLATQLEALEAVTILAAEDPYVRQVFAGVLYKSHLAPKYKEPELRIACSKALISIKDNQVHDLWLRMQGALVSLDDRRVWAIEKECMSYLRYLNNNSFHYLIPIHLMDSDPDISFLLGRLFSNWPALVTGPVRRAYFSVATKNPHIFEWETVMKVFRYSRRNLSDDLVMG